MGKTKFQQGEKALHISDNNKEVEIVVAKKDFVTKKTKYRLTDGSDVNEGDLKKITGGINTKLKKEDPELLKLREEYGKRYGKAPASSKKNNKRWLEKKISEKEPIDPDPADDNETKYEALKALTRDGLIVVISDKDLDIDAADYDEDKDLVTAICQELDIEIPTED